MMPMPRSLGSRIFLGQLAVVFVGLVLLYVDLWRFGLAVIGGSFLAASVARALIDEEHEGMLAVRGRLFDIMWMVTLGVSLIVLGIVIPPQPPL